MVVPSSFTSVTCSMLLPSTVKASLGIFDILGLLPRTMHFVFDAFRESWLPIQNWSSDTYLVMETYNLSLAVFHGVGSDTTILNRK